MELAGTDVTRGEPAGSHSVDDARREIAWLRARVAELEQALARAGGDASPPAESRLEALLESSPAGIAIWDAEDRLVASNSLYRDMFFRGCEEFVRHGQTFTEQSRQLIATGRGPVIAGSTAGFLDERTRRRLLPGAPFEQRIDGRWILSRESRSPEGGMISVHLDVTPLKSAEAALRGSEERLRAIYEGAGVGIVLLNVAGDLVQCNSTFARMLGYSATELQGRNYADYTHPEDLQEDADAFAEMHAGELDHYSLEKRYVHKDGQLVWGRFHVSRLGERGSADAFCVVVVEDISRAKAAEQALRLSEATLRESEQRFRVMADTMPALLWMDDAEGRCVFVNKTWADYTGHALEEQLGLGWTQSVHPDDMTASVAIAMQARRERRPFTGTYRLRRADGQYRWFVDTGTPRFGSDGTFLGFIGTLLDITEQRRLEEELHQAQKMEAIGQLTGGVAHDFNNLLTVIIGNLEMVIDSAVEPPVADMSRLALEAAERGASLTERLLAFARRQTLSPQPLDVAELVAGLGALLERTLGSEITIAVSSQADPWLALADRNQLENALLNLAINARDAMPGGGSLTVEIANRAVGAVDRSELPPGRYVAIEVRDTGEGMGPEVLEKAVQPFFTTKEPGRGSGLGLSMIYGFARQSGGQLDIESEPGVGTTVTLFLPAAAGEAAGSRSEPGTNGDVPGSRGDALVVDDDPGVLQFAVALLEGIGYRVATAPDAAAALRQIGEGRRLDLLLSDVVLPGGMNGVQLARTAWQQRPELRILLMSGYPQDAFDGQGFPAPLLHKPFRKRDLLDALAR